MKERIKQFIEYQNINAGELSTLLEVQRSNISHILNGRNKPGATFIEKMLLVFPNLNARWLLTGEGEMLNSNSTNIKSSDSVEQELKFSEKESDIKNEKEKPLIEKPKQKEQQGIAVDIVKVILIYEDGSFSSFNPSSKNI